MKNILLSLCVLFAINLQLSAQSVTVTASSTSLCELETINFSYTQTGLTEPISCLWDLGDGLVSTQCFPSHIFAQGGLTYFVCLTLTDGNGVEAQDCIDIVVFSSPTPYIIGTDSAGNIDDDGDGLICDLPTVLSLDQTYDQYMWSIGSLSPSEQITEANTYTVTIHDSNGCTAFASATVSPPDPAYTIAITDNGSNNAICPGSSVTLDAGVDYLSYEWSTGETTQTITTSTAGNYAVTVMDSNGCFNTSNLLVEESAAPEINIIATNTTCNQADGMVEIEVVDGSGNYTFALSNGMILTGASPFIVTGLAAGTYEANIIDDNTGCGTSASFIISDIFITADIVITDISDASCFGVADGMVEYEVSPATNLTSHIESSTNGNVYNNGFLPPDNYCIIATDINGCISGTECFDILEPAALNPVGNTNALFCPGESVEIFVNDDYDIYNWSITATVSTPSIFVNTAGTYTVTVTDTNGCTASLEYNVAAADDCVWPGDANYDGVANNQDVLFLGMAYGNIGQTRDDATINWEGQLAEFEWDSVFNTSINQKHADSDGNGIVEQDDTLAIVQNYNLTPHELRGMGEDGFPLYVNFDVASEDYGERVELQINLGDLGQSVPEAYGIAFSLLFNYPEVINPSTIEIDFSNSVLGQEDELITLSKMLLEQGRMDFAITRFDHIDMTDLSGELMSLSFIIEDNIDGFTSANYTLEANPVDVLCVHSWGGEVVLAGNSGNILMLGSSAISDLPTVDSGVNYYPNPTKDKLYINMQDNSMIQQVRVFDTLGKLVTAEKEDNIQYISTDYWIEGIYFLEITNDEGMKYLLKVIKE